MFNDIGKKIKILAEILCIIGIIASIIIALIMFNFANSSYLASEGNLYMVLGIAFLILGPLLSWANASFIYGFGELIDNVYDIKISMCDDESESEDQEEINAEI